MSCNNRCNAGFKVMCAIVFFIFFIFTKNEIDGLKSDNDILVTEFVRMSKQLDAASELLIAYGKLRGLDQPRFDNIPPLEPEIRPWQPLLRPDESE